MDPAQFNELYEMLTRLGGATLLGAILGINRDLHRKPAGLRVLAMVCMGACAITMVSVISTSDPANLTDPGVLRTVQGVLSGIGFLGAGVIMRSQGKDEVHGLTTAASIWGSAILGMICGMGQWMLAGCVFVLAWLILTLGQAIENVVLRLAPVPQSSAKESADRKS
jgi:putative Mg2+ transporter-C (MgtC) family protein